MAGPVPGAPGPTYLLIGPSAIGYNLMQGFSVAVCTHPWMRAICMLEHCRFKMIKSIFCYVGIRPFRQLTAHETLRLINKFFHTNTLMKKRSSYISVIERRLKNGQKKIATKTQRHEDLSMGNLCALRLCGEKN